MVIETNFLLDAIQASTVSIPLKNQFKELFSNRSLSLSKTCAVYQKHFDRIVLRCATLPEEKDNFSEYDAERLQKDLKLLLEIREICNLAIEARTCDVLPKTIREKIATVIEKFCKLLGFKTSVEKAELLRKKCDIMLGIRLSHETLQTIPRECAEILKSEQFLQEATIQTSIDFLRNRVMSQGKRMTEFYGPDCNAPEGLFIAEPNGDVLHVHLDQKIGTGASKHIFHATEYSIGKKPKHLAIMSFYPYLKNGFTFQEYYDDCPKKLDEVNGDIKHESVMTATAKNIPGIVSIGTPVPVKFKDKDILFAKMEFYPLGNILHFLKDKNFNEKQKNYLIFFLINTIQQLHELGMVHNDLKLENILLKYNHEHDLYESIIIDFEKSHLLGENERKPASTPAALPPEYAKFYVNHPEQQIVPKELFPTFALDLWNLGLVLYRIKYDENFVSTGLSGGQLMQVGQLHHWFNSEAADQRFASLQGEEPADKLIRSLLAFDPNTRCIDQDSLAKLASLCSE